MILQDAIQLLYIWYPSFFLHSIKTNPKTTGCNGHELKTKKFGDLTATLLKLVSSPKEVRDMWGFIMSCRLDLPKIIKKVTLKKEREGKEIELFLALIENTK